MRRIREVVREGRGEDETVGNVTYNLGGDAGGAGAWSPTPTFHRAYLVFLILLLASHLPARRVRLSFSEEMHADTKQHLLDYCEGGRAGGR